ncbi:MAG: DNA-3-methyladenine glycosylase [Actinobacteria bacterium]|nr:DNA-3-methyladenine glycosylase [Actinomycetota bacterium]
MTGGIRDVLAGPVDVAARALLGCRFTTGIGGERTAVVLTEVEAYGGADDPASHAHRGRTARNAAMFGPPGRLYVYRSYGIHWCMNVVTGPEGAPAAVLLRAGSPAEGVEVMERRRGRRDHLTDGPGKLAQALGVGGEWDGASLFEAPLSLEPPVSPPRSVDAGPRVGITREVDRPWRFVLRRG